MAARFLCSAMLLLHLCAAQLRRPQPLPLGGAALAFRAPSPPSFSTPSRSWSLSLSLFPLHQSALLLLLCCTNACTFLRHPCFLETPHAPLPTNAPSCTLPLLLPHLKCSTTHTLRPWCPSLCPSLPVAAPFPSTTQTHPSHPCCSKQRHAEPCCATYPCLSS